MAKNQKIKLSVWTHNANERFGLLFDLYIIIILQL